MLSHCVSLSCCLAVYMRGAYSLVGCLTILRSVCITDYITFSLCVCVRCFFFLLLAPKCSVFVLRRSLLLYTQTENLTQSDGSHGIRVCVVLCAKA